MEKYKKILQGIVAKRKAQMELENILMESKNNDNEILVRISKVNKNSLGVCKNASY